jgi:malonate-semialdehyde dehydrogenase (acetylating)/methylmalonate-semialdehyde dehydrogenase
VEGFPNGNWMGPTILTNVTTSMDCYKEEIFGPVLVCLHVDTLDEAIALVNANKWGNGTAIFTTSGAAARKYTMECQAGQVRLRSLPRSRSVAHLHPVPHRGAVCRNCRWV